MRLVDADAIEKQAYDDVHHHAELEDWEFDVVTNYLARAATIDAVPVVHGRWASTVVEVYLGGGFRTGAPHCTVCNKQSCSRTPYCPNCGARMDGGAADGV